MPARRNLSNELILQVAQEAELNSGFVSLMAIAGVLTAVALLTNSVAVLIGAMVIAPALPPLALVVFGFAGGQPLMAWRGLRTAVLGVLVAVAGAVLVTVILRLLGIYSNDTDVAHLPLLEERVRPGWYSIVAAFAAGIAAVVGTVKKRMDTLIGVVAAVALVPAGAAAAISLVAGDMARAAGGLTMLLINVMVIIAAGLIAVVIMRPGAAD
jgi:uncharacterized hydrophobic protein (TIGR00271 family)